MRTLVLLILCAITAYAQVSLLSANNNALISAEFKLPSVSVNNVDDHGKVYSTYSFPGNSGFTNKKGAPELPFISIPVRLQKSGNVTITIDSIKYRYKKGNTPFPALGNLTRNIDPSTVTRVEGIEYSNNSWYPSQSIGLGQRYKIRDIEGINIKIYPIAYNGAEHTTRFVQKVYFSLYENGTIINRSINTHQSEEFKGIENRFINSSKKVRYNSVYDGDRMIIITTSRDSAAANTLAQWKNRKGIKTDIYIYPSETGSGYSALKNFIKDKYTNDNLTYVTLIGDIEDIPSKRENYGANDGDGDVASDPSYSFLSGNDTYPDIFVGRISVSSLQEAQNYVHKLITYEMTPQVGASWYVKAVSAGSNEGTPKDYEWLHDSINSKLLQSTYLSVDEITQDNNKTTSDMSSYINDGRGLVNFMGHGNNDGFGFKSSFWYSKNIIKNLHNGDKLPVVIPLACQFGAFRKSEVAAETWLRNPNGGAIAVMGSTPLMDWTPPQYAQVEMNRLIAKSAHSSMGAYFYNGEMKMLDISSSQGDKTIKTWTYFGDPSLYFISKVPTQTTITQNGQFVRGNNDVTFSGDTGTIITVYSKDMNIFETKKITTNSVTFTTTIDGTGELYITALKKNSAPYLDSLYFSDSSYHNVAPSNIFISNDTITENDIQEVFIGKLTTADSNSNDTHSYTLVDGDTFMIKHDSLFTNGILSEGSYTIIIKSTDQGGLSINKEFIITVTQISYYDLISTCSWDVSVDSMDSEASFDIDTTTNTLAITLLRGDDPNYEKWASVIGSFEGSLTDSATFKISYKATDSVKFVLPMEELEENGEGHYITLLPCDTDTTVTFTLSQLEQPYWVSNKIPLDIGKVSSLVFELASNNTDEVSGHIDVKSLLITGYQSTAITIQSKSITGSNAFSLRIDNNRLRLTSLEAGEFKIAIYTVAGRLLFNKTVTMKKGENNILLPSLSSGVKLIRVVTPKNILTTRSIIK